MYKGSGRGGGVGRIREVVGRGAFQVDVRGWCVVTWRTCKVEVHDMGGSGGSNVADVRGGGVQRVGAREACSRSVSGIAPGKVETKDSVGEQENTKEELLYARSPPQLRPQQPQKSTKFTAHHPSIRAVFLSIVEPEEELLLECDGGKRGEDCLGGIDSVAGVRRVLSANGVVGPLILNGKRDTTIIVGGIFRQSDEVDGYILVQGIIGLEPTSVPVRCDLGGRETGCRSLSKILYPLGMALKVALYGRYLSLGSILPTSSYEVRFSARSDEFLFKLLPLTAQCELVDARASTERTWVAMPVDQQPGDQGESYMPVALASNQVSITPGSRLPLSTSSRQIHMHSKRHNPVTGISTSPPGACPGGRLWPASTLPVTFSSKNLEALTASPEQLESRASVAEPLAAALTTGVSLQYSCPRWVIPYPASRPTGLMNPKVHSLFINRWGDRRSREITLDEARTWGSADRQDTETIFVRANSTTTERFCIRLVLNPREVVRRKASPQYAAYRRLIDDAKFIPINSPKQREVSCLGTMGSGSWRPATGTREIPFLRVTMLTFPRILVGRTFEALHDYGVDHGGLGNSEKFRHVVVDLDAPGLSKEDWLNGKAPRRFLRGRARPRLRPQAPNLASWLAPVSK
ncbi:hypothetical protein C8R46DRAFT_1030680 [Mycena filopes]|nr:hypothetical protein C8R46DRAFT_1030680 [Mycena filopes]